MTMTLFELAYFVAGVACGFFVTVTSIMIGTEDRHGRR